MLNRTWKRRCFLQATGLAAQRPLPHESARGHPGRERTRTDAGRPEYRRTGTLDGYVEECDMPDSMIAAIPGR